MDEHEGPEIVPDDDGFHSLSDHWWETETAWFSFNVPERRLGGWLYNQVLGVQGVCNGGAWVWDDSPAPALYERHDHGLPYPERGDLRQITLPNGNSIRVVEPLRVYDLRYTDPGRLEVDLTFTASMRPHSHPLAVLPFLKGRHFDQPGRVHGHVLLHGERIDVDCFSNRDRSWGPRPLGPDPRRPPRVVTPRERRALTGVGYVFANASAGESFLAYTCPHEDGSDDLVAGYLLRQGVYAPLVRGRRQVRFAPDTGVITEIDLEGEDATGRHLDAHGTLVSRHGERGPNGTGLFTWTWNGLDGWGEDQSFCPEAVWAAVGAPRA